MAVVGGNEVVNPFNVTEVYVKVDGAWRLGVAFVHPAVDPAVTAKGSAST